MRICGISFNASNTVLAIIDQSDDGTISPVACETRQIPLYDHEDSACLHSFIETVNALMRDFSINSIAIRKCSYSGKYPSGAASLKMEALLQVADVVAVLVSPQTVAACCKSANVPIPAGIRKYQRDAFDVAVAYATQLKSRQ